jgi:hypothetical protein
MIERQRMIDAIAESLEPHAWARAVWLGGSDATGRTDTWSDIDIQVLVEDDRVEDALEAVHAALAELSPIAHRHRFPEPTWHGHAQELLSLRDADPCHFVDLVVMRRGRPGRLLEPERHGTPAVLFDKDGEVRPEPLDRAAHEAKMQARLGALRQTFFLLQNLTTKAVRRGDVADAVQHFHAFTVRPLVELLRIRHCPDRWDFGLRYLDRDLPADVRAEVVALMLPATLDAVEEHRARAEAMFRACLADRDAGRWGRPAAATGSGR